MEVRKILVPAYSPTDEMHERGLHEVSRAIEDGCHSRDQICRVYYEGCLKSVDEGISDLEVVRRAIEAWGKKYPKLNNFHLAVFADGSFGFHGDGLNYDDHQEVFESDGPSMDELLALSKHIIGYKS